MPVYLSGPSVRSDSPASDAGAGQRACERFRRMVLRDLFEQERRPTGVLFLELSAHALESLDHGLVIAGRPILDLEDQKECRRFERVLVARRDSVTEPEQVAGLHVP